MKMNEINVDKSLLCFGRIIDNVTMLGPGKRTCIWVRGCSRTPKCKMCTSPELHSFRTDCFLPVSCVADCLLPDKRNENNRTDLRLTISGGEPLDQPEALASMLRMVRAYYTDILLYTGKTYETLTPEEKEAAELVDVLIDGNYIPEKDDGLPLRGSSNQKLTFMPGCRPGLEKEYREYLEKSSKRDCEFTPYNGAIIRIGIPDNRRGDNGLW